MHSTARSVGDLRPRRMAPAGLQARSLHTACSRPPLRRPRHAAQGGRSSAPPASGWRPCCSEQGWTGGAGRETAWGEMLGAHARAPLCARRPLASWRCAPPPLPQRQLTGGAPRWCAAPPPRFRSWLQTPPASAPRAARPPGAAAAWWTCRRGRTATPRLRVQRDGGWREGARLGGGSGVHGGTPPGRGPHSSASAAGGRRMDGQRRRRLEGAR